MSKEKNPPKIYLIRHGETAWTVSRRHTGRTDLPLLPQGEADAKLVKKAVQHVFFTKVYSSPLQRALQTSRIVDLDAQIEIDPDLVEWNYGDYEGLTSVEIKKQQPDWAIFSHGAKGGESVQEISDRADRVIERLLELHPTGTIALFSSGHFSRVLIARWLEMPAQIGARFLIGTASISVLTFEKGVRVLELLNQECHKKPAR